MKYSYETLECQMENKIFIITVNRPKVLNALNSKVFSELSAVFDRIGLENDVDVVILTGMGDKAFIAGSDVSQMVELTSLQGRAFALAVNKAQQKIAASPKPTIAAVNGFAFGGGLEVAMCCDIRVASERAKFGQPELNVGLIPGGGGTQRLQRLVGQGIAKEMIFTAKIIDAIRAYEIGLVNRVVPHEQLMEQARTVAEEMASKSSVLLQFAKSAIDTGAEIDLESALKNEIELFAQCFSTLDGLEGMRAFLEKRKPDFIGN